MESKGSNKKLLRIATISTVFLITCLLMELCSYLILRIDHTYDEFIFHKTNSLGKVIPDEHGVLPVKKNYKTVWKNPEFEVKINTNKIGIREDFNFEYKDVDIAFMGDSFTFGHGVEADERYSNLVAKNYPNLVVASLSYLNGFQPEHYEFFLKNHPSLRPKIVVVGLFLGNDLGPDLMQTIYDPEKNLLEIPDMLITSYGQRINSPQIYMFPFNYLVGSSNFFTLLVKYANRFQMSKYFLKNAKYSMESAVNTRELESGQTNLNQNRAIQSILRIQKLLEKRNTNLVVLLIPQFFYTKYDPTRTSLFVGQKYNLMRAYLELGDDNLLEQIKNFCTKSHLSCIDLAKDLSPEDYFIFDGHWKQSGHAKASSKLLEYFSNKK